MKKLVFILLMVLSFVSNAQEELVLRADTNSVAIGERIVLSLEVPQELEEYKILIPDTGMSIGQQIEVLKRFDPDTINSDLGTFYQHSFLVTAFDTGYVVVPPFEVKSSTDTLRSNPLMLFFSYPAVDVSGDIKDVKTPVSVELTFWDKVRLNKAKIIIGFSLLLLLILIFLLYQRSKKRKKNKPIIKAEAMSAFQIAWERFIALQNKSLYGKGMIKDHYIELSNILRWYVEGQFKVNAGEETTDEILRDMKSMGVHRGDLGKLKKVLEQADMVKFAKAKPGVLEHEQVMKSARSFLQDTKNHTNRDD